MSVDIPLLKRPLRSLLNALCLTAIVIALQPVAPAHAATLTVTTTNDELNNNGQCSLREAIENANAGATTWADCVPVGVYGADIITLPAGTYTLTTGSELAITSDITINGAGAGTTIIQASTVDPTPNPSAPGVATWRVMNITGSTVNLNGVTVRHGNNSVPGVGGGGISLTSASTLTIDASSISNNYDASGKGGGIFSWADCNINLINGSSISNNRAFSPGLASGGGVFFWANWDAYLGGSITIDNSTVTGNTSNGNAGGLYVEYGPLNIQNGSTITGNTASSGYGGGVVGWRLTLNLLSGASISGNTAATDGGGIYTGDSTNFTINGDITGNTATTGNGGALYNCTVWDPSGGTINLLGGANLSNNTAGNLGGGVYLPAGTMTINGATIANNISPNDGSGIWAPAGTVTASNLTIGPPGAGSGTNCDNFQNDNGGNTQIGDATCFMRPDLTVAKSNSVGGAVNSGSPWDWILDISNGGTAAATFTGGDMLLLDDLPLGPLYPATASVTITGGSVTGTATCLIAANSLSCTVSAGGMTIGPGASLRVTITGITAGIGSYTNPAAVCQVDPLDAIAESDETNNNCNTDTVTASDLPPAVSSTVPANGAVGVAAAANLTVTFSEPVNVAGDWFQINCASSGTRNVADTVVGGGPTTWTIDPNADFTPIEVCTVTIFAAQVTDQDLPADNMAADYTWNFTVGTPSGGGGGGGKRGAAQIQAPAACDLVIDVAADREVVIPGDRVVWTILIRNRGSGECQGVRTYGTMPDGFSITDIETTRGSVNWDGGQYYLVEVGTVYANETVTVSIASLLQGGAGLALPEGVVAAQSTGRQICLTGYITDPLSDTACVTLFPDTLPPTGGQPVKQIPPWVWVVAAGVLIAGMAVTRSGSR